VLATVEPSGANVPGWVDVDRFDLVAKAPSRATQPQLQEMLQSLLIERFKLKAHRGSKEVPIYELALAQQDNPGPGLTPSQIDCPSIAGEPSPCGLSGRAGRLGLRYARCSFADPDRGGNAPPG
jgi:uncharacterized protein (TIGR03435 family)